MHVVLHDLSKLMKLYFYFYSACYISNIPIKWHSFDKNMINKIVKLVVDTLYQNNKWWFHNIYAIIIEMRKEITPFSFNFTEIITQLFPNSYSNAFLLLCDRCYEMYLSNTVVALLVQNAYRFLSTLSILSTWSEFWWVKCFRSTSLRF